MKQEENGIKPVAGIRYEKADVLFLYKGLFKAFCYRYYKSKSHW
jgi:hypothetical protein